MTQPSSKGQPLTCGRQAGGRVEELKAHGSVVERTKEGRRKISGTGQLLTGGDHAGSLAHTAKRHQRGALRDQHIGEWRDEVAVLGRRQDPLRDLDRLAVVLLQHVCPRELRVEHDQPQIGRQIGELDGTLLQQRERLSHPVGIQEDRAQHRRRPGRGRSVAEFPPAKQRILHEGLGFVETGGSTR